MEIVIIVLIVLGLIVTVTVINLSDKKKEIDRTLSSIEGFKATQLYVGANLAAAVALDEAQERLCLLESPSREVSYRLVSYRDLLSAELFEDGVTVTKTVRSSQAIGAIVGGVAFGGVGAVVGALTGRSESETGKVNYIDLRLVINDTSNPNFDIRFLALKSSRDGLLYKQAMQQARHWHSLVAVLIKRADSDTSRKENLETVTRALPSVADELRKLVDLRDSGALSSEEFQVQKARLLQP